VKNISILPFMTTGKHLARRDLCTPDEIMQTDQRYPFRVLVFGASLRSASLNVRLASLAESIVQKHGGEVDRASMADFDCPSYNEDVEADPGIPEGARRLHDRLQACDAFIVSSPEYNGSMPGTLKNVIDWTSRIRPQPFNGKQGLLLSASPSMAGGNRGLWSLRVPMEHLGARLYPDMFSLAKAHTAFGDDGQLRDERLQHRLETTLSCFLDLVEASKHYRRIKKEWVEFLGEHPDIATDRVETVTT
jgi:chromate reductase, NAD(P)H dehydrogenase (quinone)